MVKGEMLYEGKAKKIFATEQPDCVVQYFKDDATAFNAQKRGTIVGKGVINNKVSERLFRLLEQAGVPTHFVERLSDREMLTKKVMMRLFTSPRADQRSPESVWWMMSGTSRLVTSSVSEMAYTASQKKATRSNSNDERG